MCDILINTQSEVLMMYHNNGTYANRVQIHSNRVVYNYEIHESIKNILNISIITGDLYNGNHVYILDEGSLYYLYTFMLPKSCANIVKLDENIQQLATSYCCRAVIKRGNLYISGYNGNSQMGISIKQVHVINNKLAARNVKWVSCASTYTAIIKPDGVHVAGTMSIDKDTKKRYYKFTKISSIKLDKIIAGDDYCYGYNKLTGWLYKLHWENNNPYFKPRLSLNDVDVVSFNKELVYYQKCHDVYLLGDEVNVLVYENAQIITNRNPHSILAAQFYASQLLLYSSRLNIRLPKFIVIKILLIIDRQLSFNNGKFSSRLILN